MNGLKLFLLSILFLPFLGQTQALSGSERMDYEIRKMISDLKMSEQVQAKFIDVYRKYGALMKKAKQSGINQWSLYMLFLKASRERDFQMNEILSSQQYNFYLKRQKVIDNIASGL